MDASHESQITRAPHVRRLAGRALWIVSTCCIAVATLLPSAQRFSGDPWCIVCGETGSVDVLLNILLFAPFGAGMALAGVPWRRAAGIVVGFTVAIEVLQFAVIPGRDASLGDILANSVGGIAGLVVGTHIDALLWPAPRAARQLVAAWTVVWTLVQLTAAAALLPSDTDRGLVGQIGRALGGRPRYPGRVLATTIDSAPIPNTRFADPSHARHALARGAVVDVTVVPPDTAPWWRAPIVRIVDDSLREALLVGQDGADLVFGVGTRAAAMRLRPLFFVAHDVFPLANADAQTPDTLRIQATYATNGVMLRVASREHGAREVRLAVTHSAGWRLIFPWPVFDDGSLRNAIANVLWIVALLTPGAYWAARAGHVSTRGAGAVRALAVTALLAAIGLAAVPWLLGVGVPPVWSVAEVLAR
ncbi:MAG TPA: VanZ family protein [Gemmatimonadaceae bacterium]|nr:VanZ family protein [Gemmatimonadaceae bacterium]